MKTKLLKYIGNLLTIFALLFIFLRLIKYDIDYSILFSANNVMYLLLFTIAYALQVCVLGLSWRKILYILTRKKISFYKISTIFCKANLMKYIPGNVFQYLGRNELAIKEDLKHIDVGFATLIDTAINVFAVLLISLISYSSGIQKWLETIKIENIKIPIIMLFIMITCILILLLIFKKNIYQLLITIKAKFTISDLSSIIGCIVFYMFFSIYTSIIYILVLQEMLGVLTTFPEKIIIMGAYLLSWLLGFITPGAPGGIGVREAALTLFLGDSFNIESILLGIVIYRLINILGDFLAVIFSKIFELYNIKKQEKSVTD